MRLGELKPPKRRPVVLVQPESSQVRTNVQVAARQNHLKPQGQTELNKRDTHRPVPSLHPSKLYELDSDRKGVNVRSDRRRYVPLRQSGDRSQKRQTVQQSQSLPPVHA
jgi:hypothetical protein